MTVIPYAKNRSKSDNNGIPELDGIAEYLDMRIMLSEFGINFNIGIRNNG